MYWLRATRLKRSSSRFAPVQVIEWTLSRRIISAREMPNSAVLMAPASVIIIFPPRSRCAVYASAASFKAAALKCRKWRSMNWLMVPIFTSPTLQSELLAFDAKLIPRQSSVNRDFAENFLRHCGNNRRCQDFRGYAEQKYCRSEHNDCGSRKQIRRQTIDTSSSWERRGINENRLQHNEVIVKRDQTAEKRDRYEPE